MNLYHGGWFSPRDSQLLDQSKPTLITDVEKSTSPMPKAKSNQSTLEKLFRKKSLTNLQSSRNLLNGEVSVAPTVSLIKNRLSIESPETEAFPDLGCIAGLLQEVIKREISPPKVGLTANTDQVMAHLNNMKLDKSTEVQMAKKFDKERFQEMLKVVSSQKFQKKKRINLNAPILIDTSVKKGPYTSAKFISARENQSKSPNFLQVPKKIMARHQKLTNIADPHLPQATQDRYTRRRSTLASATGRSASVEMFSFNDPVTCKNDRFKRGVSGEGSSVFMAKNGRSATIEFSKSIELSSGIKSSFRSIAVDNGASRKKIKLSGLNPSKIDIPKLVTSRLVLY